MIVIVNRFLLRKGFQGMALWPFVIVREKSLLNDEVLINHERIHLRQQLEMGIVFFFLWYVVEFVLRWIRTGNRRKAYRNISFEQEAFKYEKSLHYLKQRPIWSFLKYK